MPVVAFERSVFGEACEVDAPQGGRLVDICDAIQSPVPFSCRGATCGTCLIEILQGAELFEAPGLAEAELLRLLTYPPSMRLACQAEVKACEGFVRLRISDDEL